MDRSYPYSRRLVSRARLRKRIAAVTGLGLVAASAVFMLAWKPDPIAASQPSFIPSPVLNGPLGAGEPLRHGARRIYPYSVVPGGVSDAVELRRIIRSDSVVAAHYATFDAAKARAIVVDAPRAVHVSYRKGDKVYWTAHKVMLAPGETLLSDGRSEMRARCANRISDLPRYPVEDHKPAMEELDQPIELADGERYTLGQDGMPVAMGDEDGIGRQAGGVRGPAHFGGSAAGTPADSTHASTSLSSASSMGPVSTLGLSGSSSSLGSRPRPAGLPVTNTTVNPTPSPAATPGSGSHNGSPGSPAPSGGATTPAINPGSGSVEPLPGPVADSGSGGGGSSGSPAFSGNAPAPVVEPDRSSVEPAPVPVPVPGTTMPEAPVEGTAPPSGPAPGPRPGTPLPGSTPQPAPGPGPAPLPAVEQVPVLPVPPAVPPALPPVSPQTPQPGPVPQPVFPKPELEPEPLPLPAIEQPAPAEVPEPGSLWLFGLALAAMGLLRRPRRAA